MVYVFFTSVLKAHPWCFHLSTMERCVRTGQTSTAVRHCCSAVGHGGWVYRFVGVSMGSWVAECASVGTWLIVCFRDCGW